MALLFGVQVAYSPPTPLFPFLPSFLFSFSARRCVRAACPYIQSTLAPPSILLPCLGSQFRSVSELEEEEEEAPFSQPRQEGVAVVRRRLRGEQDRASLLLLQTYRSWRGTPCLNIICKLVSFSFCILLRVCASNLINPRRRRRWKERCKGTRRRRRRRL